MNTQDVILLCPVCQNTRHCTVGINVHDEPVSKDISPTSSMGIAIWARCTNCKADMYSADKDLIDALKMLNDAGYKTTSHCSMSHPEGGHENGCVRVNEYLYDRALYESGPFIMIAGMSKEQIEGLYIVARDYAKRYDDDTNVRLEVYHKSESESSMFGRPAMNDRITLQLIRKP